MVFQWQRKIGDYMKEAEKQISDENIYRKVEFKEKTLIDFVEASNHLFKILKIKGCISDKIMK